MLMKKFHLYAAALVIEKERVSERERDDMASANKTSFFSAM